MSTAVAAACALIIVACGTSSGTVDDNRQFANEAVTRTPDTAATVTPTAVLDVDATPATRAHEASPEALLRSRGAPSTLYIEAGDRLLSLSIRDGAAVATPINVPSRYHILGFDASPAGDRVAVLLADTHDDAALALFSREGKMLGGPISVLRGDSATPEAKETRSTRYFVDWSPQGADVLVSDGRSLETVHASGEVAPIRIEEFDGQLLNATFSPQGSRVALHFQYEDGSGHVFVRDLVTGKTRELRALSTSANEGLTNLQWLPNGVGLVYVRGPLDRGIVTNGQAYVYRLGQERAEVVATPGRGGPSATITDVAVSPDGHSVAYVISLLDGSTWSFHSMWVRSLDGSGSYQVPVVPRGVVGHVAWVNGGISWEQRRDSSAPGQVLITGTNGLPVVILNTATSRIVATPGATPVGSPAATPVGSPAATPIATPQT